MKDGAFELLEWDSEFFGFAVFKIKSSEISAVEVERTLSFLKSQHSARLVYLEVPSQKVDLYSSALRNGGMLVDFKTKYTGATNSLSVRAVIEGDLNSRIQLKRVSEPNPELLRLVRNAGVFSRFRIDPYIGEELCGKLYEEWLLKSISRDLADEVLGVAHGGVTKGFITLAGPGDHGEIGLLSVCENARGRGIGRYLIDAATLYFRDLGCEKIQVVTQGVNLPACRAYESVGYVCTEKNLFFHFWP